MNAQSIIKKSVLLILPQNNFNDTEYLTVKNYLERNNIKVFIASDSNALSTGSLGLKVKADVSFFNLNERNFSAIIFIGGSGVADYWNDQSLHSAAMKFYNSRKTVAAICSSVIIIARAGLLSGKIATCFPDVRKELEKERTKFIDQNVVISDNIITAQGPSSASEFAEAVLDSILS